jgi:acyl-CoA thioester hydrolase
MGAVTSTQVLLPPSAYPVLLRHDARYSDLDPSRRIGRDALVRWFEDARVAVERTRFGADDTNRHVNNVRLAGWYLDGLAELHLDVLGYPTGGPLDGLSPSSLSVQYLDEVHYPGIYQLRVGVLDLDDTTARYACGLFDGPRCIGLAEAVGAHRVLDEDAVLDGDAGVGDLGALLEPFLMRPVRPLTVA